MEVSEGGWGCSTFMKLMLQTRLAGKNYWHVVYHLVLKKTIVADKVKTILLEYQRRASNITGGAEGYFVTAGL